jgi:hypothetical protein
MADYYFLLFIGAFALIGCFIWDWIIDRSFRRLPSDWLGYSFLAGIVVLLGYASKYLDEFRTHLYRASFIALIVAAFFTSIAIVLWRKAGLWDENSRRRRNKNRQSQR